ncbi:hypothetical protein [Nakamurella aerolata]|uniref:ABC transporter n=1 Tax=Nakamurella aerolata TaxID=1656892 RepID=A0A849A964_9ACTN|nr:hypothetical protein [Nakamurella aerolata]NNG35621.1 hypothetical protein [Nakamurella aerolata]
MRGTRSLLGLVRYQLATLGMGYRAVPPLVLFIAVCAISYSDPSAPLGPQFALTAGAMCAVGCWLAVVAVSSDPPTRRAVVAARMQAPARHVAGYALAAAVPAAIAVAVSTIWAGVAHRFPGGCTVVITVRSGPAPRPAAPPPIADPYTRSWCGQHDPLAELGTGALAQLAAALIGIAVGLWCSALLWERLTTTLTMSVLLLAAVLALPWTGVLNPLLRTLSEAVGLRDTAQLGPATLSTLAGLALLAVTVAAIAAIGRRRRWT